MNLKKIAFASLLFTLMMLATFASMVGSAVAMGAANYPREKILIPNVQFIAGSDDVNDTIIFAVANVGPISVNINGYIVRDEMGNTVTLNYLGSSQVAVEKGTFKFITLTFNPDTIVNGTQYTLTVTTAGGGSFVLSSFNRSSSAEYDPLKDLQLQSMLQESARSTPPPQGATLYGPVYVPIPPTIIIGAGIVAAFSVMNAYVLSKRIVGSKNRRDRLVVFFFISVIFVSIIVFFVSFFWGGQLATM